MHHLLRPRGRKLRVQQVGPPDPYAVDGALEFGGWQGVFAHGGGAFGAFEPGGVFDADVAAGEALGGGGAGLLD